MEIHFTLGFWFVRVVIAIAFMCLFAHFYTKAQPDSSISTVLAIIGAVVLFWGTYSLVALVK